MKTRATHLLNVSRTEEVRSGAMVTGLGADPDVATGHLDANRVVSGLSRGVIADVILTCEFLPNRLHRRPDRFISSQVNRTTAGFLRKRVDGVFVDEHAGPNRDEIDQSSCLLSFEQDVLETRLAPGIDAIRENQQRLSLGFASPHLAQPLDKRVE